MKNLILLIGLLSFVPSAIAFGGAIIGVSPNTTLQAGESVTINVTCSGQPQSPTVPPVWVPFQSYKLLATDSEEQYGEAVKSFDGRVDTIWHTQYKTVTPQLPHYVAIDLQVSFDLSKFRYLSRQDTQQGGRVKNYAFYVSANGVDWGSPVVVGVFPDTNTEQVVSFPITTGRYVKFEARSEHAGGPYSSAAELAVFGTLTKVPKQPQIEPAASTTQTWVVHNNGRVDRPVYVVVNGTLVPHKTERATYGEPCGAFYARVGSTKLEYRRLVRNNDFISICAGK